MTTRATALSNDLHDYITDHSLREPDVLQRLRRVTSDMSEGSWQVSPEQGQFMTLLAGIAGVKRYLEVGTFTGYGTLWMALALPNDGQIVSCEIENSFPSVGRPFWAEAGVTDMIDLRIAPAIETLDSLIADGQAGTFDMAFIDADKPPYADYYERCLQLVRVNGLVLIDNVLWGGAVIDDADTRGSSRGIRAVNDIVRDDRRVAISMLPIGDGLTIARKLQ